MDAKVCYTALAPGTDQRVAAEKLGFDPLRRGDDPARRGRSKKPPGRGVDIGELWLYATAGGGRSGEF